MKLFFDTSAFAKRYVHEEGSEKVDSLCYRAGKIFISILCVTEMMSSLSRLVREKSIEKTEYQKVKSSLFVDLKSLALCNITPSVVERSILLLEKNSLKSLDALQLASALETGASAFVSADVQQLKAARRCRIKTFRV